MGTEAVSGTVRDLLDPHKPSFDRLPSIKAFDKVRGYDPICLFVYLFVVVVLGLKV